MPQLVFLHGPGAGGCAEGFQYQLKSFPGSLAPTLPGHLRGAPCTSVARYTEWLRGWLWAQGHERDLILVGFTLGACIALQYGLDYPEEVRACSSNMSVPQGANTVKIFSSSATGAIALQSATEI